jgi:molybdopterin-binding protein
MKISARNVLSGKVVSVVRRENDAQVTVKISAKEKLVSVIDLEAVDRLELSKGKAVYAVIEARDVMLGIPHHKRGE